MRGIFQAAATSASVAQLLSGPIKATTPFDSLISLIFLIAIHPLGIPESPAFQTTIIQNYILVIKWKKLLLIIKKSQLN